MWQNKMMSNIFNERKFGEKYSKLLHNIFGVESFYEVLCKNALRQ